MLSERIGGPGVCRVCEGKRDAAGTWSGWYQYLFLKLSYWSIIFPRYGICVNPLYRLVVDSQSGEGGGGLLSIISVLVILRSAPV